MDDGFANSPNLADFLDSEDESIFYDEDLRLIRDDAAFRERLQELEQSVDARNSASHEAWAIRSTIKDEIAKSGDVATHDSSDQPTGFELLPGPVEVAPDGTVTQGHGREHKSLTQWMLGDILGLKNLRVSENREADSPTYPLPSSSHDLPSAKPATCPTCTCLQDPYGKTTLQELRESRGRCRSCRLVVQILEFYKSGLDGNHKVRIFAPLTKKDTLRMWCQGSTGRVSEIPFMIEIFDLAGHRPLHPSIKPAADIPGDTSSPESFAKARYWLQHCVDAHKGCASNTNVRLPTRLVRISRDPSTDLMTAKLVETNNSFGRYACLSHCWGPQGSSDLLRTTSANYEAHLNAIPMEALPRTFQHALIATYRFGLTFLWIDSLCIIQGNKADWDQEAARMGSYYSNGYVTISASWSPRPSGGCFSISEPEFISRRIHVPESLSSISVRRVLDHGRRWPLLHRGWVFQERMLSPRVLHFSTSELVWECLTCTACECGMSDTLQAELTNKGEYTRAITNAERHGLKDVWRDMVQQYTSLHLTFTSDRFAAIAGVAKQMQGYRHTNYFAGLWEDSIIGDMLWKSFPSSGQMNPRNEGNKAPTWSWASVEASWITYEQLGTCLGARGNSVAFERIEETYVKILSISGEPLAEGNSGDTEFGAIIIQGSCIRERVIHRPLYQPFHSEMIPQDSPYHEWYEERKHELKADIVLDDGSEPRFFADYGLFWAGGYCVKSGDEVVILKMAVVGKDDNDIFSRPAVLGLVLRQVGWPRTYERVGLVEFQVEKSAEAFQGSQKVVLRIV